MTKYLHLILLAAFLISCSDTNAPVTDSVPSSFIAPSGFPPVVYNFSENPYTRDGFILGRTLFYETALSKDNTLSCGLCHQQYGGFSNLGHDLSHGIENRIGNRNTPSLSNLAWQPLFTWDGGVHSLDDFSVNPIMNPVEMDESLENVLQKLRAQSKYQALFKNAFGTNEITTERLVKALSQFMIQFISNNSKYDKYLRGAEQLTLEESRGMALFNTHCSGCHSGINFTDYGFHNNGISKSGEKDKGRSIISLNTKDDYKFKVPSLRNVEVSAPYMHDGRITTLKKVLEFYSSQVNYHDNLDTLLVDKNSKTGISLTESEQNAIIAFLLTLTDRTFLENPIFSEQ